MKWIWIKDRLPINNQIIVAIMQGRQERNEDPVEDASIVILRSDDDGKEWRTLDGTEIFYFPSDEQCKFHTINYWIPWNEFIFPPSMIKDLNETSTTTSSICS